MYGRRGWWPRWPNIPDPKGYTYIGPCRCGFGPDAFYQDSSGRIAHASQVYRYGFYPVYEPTKEATKKDVEDEIELLKKERAELENRIKDLESEIKEKKEEGTTLNLWSQRNQDTEPQRK